MDCGSLTQKNIAIQCLFYYVEHLPDIVQCCSPGALIGCFRQLSHLLGGPDFCVPISVSGRIAAADALGARVAVHLDIPTQRVCNAWARIMRAVDSLAILPLLVRSWIVSGDDGDVGRIAYQRFERRLLSAGNLTQSLLHAGQMASTTRFSQSERSRQTTRRVLQLLRRRRHQEHPEGQ